MNIHVVGPAYAPTLPHHPADAFSGKTWRLCHMMKSLGHTVIHYGVEGSNPECDEHVSILSASEYADFFPQDFKQKMPGKSLYAKESPWWKMANDHAYKVLKPRIRKNDVVFYCGGNCQMELTKRIGESVKNVEPSIGYDGVFAPYCVFASYAHMHRMSGAYRLQIGRPYDTVIPNAFDLSAFEFSPDAEDYLLFLGRVIRSKGILEAITVAREAGQRLIIAGHGVTSVTKTELCTDDGGKIPIDKSVEFIGYLSPERRREVLRKAKALLVPTLYYEPFGNVVVEAHLSGTPTIGSDWGAFVETIVFGVNGFRCRTQQDYIKAINSVSLLKRSKVRDSAQKYDMEVLKCCYDGYLKSLPERS